MDFMLVDCLSAPSRLRPRPRLWLGPSRPQRLQAGGDYQTAIGRLVDRLVAQVPGRPLGPPTPQPPADLGRRPVLVKLACDRGPESGIRFYPAAPATAS